MLRLTRRAVRGHHLGGLAAMVFVAAAMTSLFVTLVNRTTALRERLAQAEETIKDLNEQLGREKADHVARMQTLERRMAEREAKEEKDAAGSEHGRGGAKAGVRAGDARGK